MSEDNFYMGKALALAAKGLGRTGTNPAVGAVLVKGGKMIGRGFHKKRGGPHAEVEALKGLDKRLIRGSSLYVTLEPCVHEDKLTPPCTRLLAGSGIKKVVAAVKDPNPLVAGKGLRELARAGIAVKTGILREEAEKLNEFYFRSIRTSLPFITLKTAVSLDGRIAVSNGDSRWITDERSRRYVHELRNIHDAVMTTSSTVLADNPDLGVRLAKGRDPLRIVIDRNSRLTSGYKVFRDDNYLIVTDENRIFDAKAGFGENAFSGYPRNFSLKAIFADLYKRGVGSVLVEAGGRFSAALLKEGLVDKCLFFIAPKIIGADGMPSVAELGFAKIRDCLKLYKVSHESFGDDFLISGYLKK